MWAFEKASRFACEKAFLHFFHFFAFYHVLLNICIYFYFEKCWDCQLFRLANQQKPVTHEINQSTKSPSVLRKSRGAFGSIQGHIIGLSTAQGIRYHGTVVCLSIAQHASVQCQSFVPFWFSHSFSYFDKKVIGKIQWFMNFTSKF